MQFVERDFLLMNDLYYVRCLNSRRVAKLFGNYDSAARRLRLLKKEGYVKVIDFLFSGEQVYALTKRGIDRINKKYYYINKVDKINHALACADFYFYLKGQGYNIKYFGLDEQITYKYQSKTNKFRPDIILQTDRWYLVEIDLSNKRFEDKIKKWEGYFLSGMFRDRFDLFPPIFIVSNNPSKVQTIINRCKQVELNYAYKDLKEVLNYNYWYKLLK